MKVIFSVNYCSLYCKAGLRAGHIHIANIPLHAGKLLASLSFLIVLPSSLLSFPAQGLLLPMQISSAYLEHNLDLWNILSRLLE